AVLEAQACGLPVIARSIPEFHEIYGDTVQYFSTINDASRELMDERELKTCATQSRDASARYDITDASIAHIRLYKELLQS
ncbi:MAG: glycosyl transferase family 1, partial [Methanomicrobiales archaeon HGW-Methanomicrobiales-4]